MLANIIQMENNQNPEISVSQGNRRQSGTENEEAVCSPDSTDLTTIDASYAWLPREILIKIFHYLDFYDIQVARLCCKEWFYISNYPEFSSKRIFKIAKCALDGDHPAAKVISANQIENLHLLDIEFGDVDELFQQIGANLKTLILETHYTQFRLLAFTNFTNLQSLKVCGFDYYAYPTKWEYLSFGDLPQLKELELDRNDSDVDKLLLACSLCSNFLEKLTLEVTEELEVEVLKILDKQAGVLKTIDFYFDAVSDGDLDVNEWKRIASKLRLKVLKLRNIFNCDIVVEMVKNQKSLRSLHLERLNINDEHLTLFVQELPQLEKVFLLYCQKVTDIGVRQLAKLSKLAVLGLKYCLEITSDGIRRIIVPEVSTRLQVLHMGNLTRVDMDAVCYCARNLQHLRILDLCRFVTGVTDKSVNEIFEYQKNLRDLYLDECKQLTDFGMLGRSSIRNLGKLEGLSLRDCEKLSDETLCGISAPHLSFLDIRGCLKITSRGISALIRNCPAIEEIAFTYSKEMNEEVVDVLTKGLSRLRTLNIEDCSAVLKQETTNWKRAHYYYYFEEYNGVILNKRTSS